MASLQEAVAAASKSSNDARDLLRLLRKEKVQRSDLVMRYGLPLLWSPGKLGEEQWTVYEQVMKAALNEARDEVAESCLKALDRRFPGSTRVKLLLAMQAESQGRWEDADAVYNAVLSENPANALALKRQVAIAKGQNKLAAAAKLLNTYLEAFAADAEAWQELGEMHASMANYESAAFCYEELLLLVPRSPHHHCRLAELYQTCGGLENSLKARKHFSASLECGPEGNTRALFGLCATCVAVAGAKPSKGSGGSDSTALEVNAALHAFAAERLLKAYKVAAPAARAAVQDMLAAQAKWVAPPEAA